jgi:hypothetical protein
MGRRSQQFEKALSAAEILAVTDLIASVTSAPPS